MTPAAAKYLEWLEQHDFLVGELDFRYDVYFGGLSYEDKQNSLTRDHYKFRAMSSWLITNPRPDLPEYEDWQSLTPYAMDTRKSVPLYQDAWWFRKFGKSE